VQDAVDDGLGEILGVLRADHHVSELARAAGRAALVNRKGQHVGGAVAPAVAAVELPDAILADELDRQVAVLDPGRRQRGERRRAQGLGRIDEVELDQVPCCWRRGARSAGACFSAYSL
jgi:hypothetical protein